MEFEINFYSEEENSDSDNDNEIPGQALPVQPFDINAVDENSVPLTSQEYLQQVIAQRAKLPAVVTASVPKLNSQSESSVANLFKEDEKIHSKHSPSKEWQLHQESDFSELRFQIISNRETWQGKYPHKFPSSRDDWFKFMFGDSVNNETVRQEPYMDCVLAMNNKMIDNLIKYTVGWVVEKKISVYSAGLWFYALLACIDAPVHITLMKHLRIFASTCRELRENIDLSSEDSEKELVAQNLFICIIGRYFGQRDLSD